VLRSPTAGRQLCTYGPLAAYHLPCYVARLLLCALAASKPALRRPASQWCFAHLLCSPYRLSAVPPAVRHRSSTAVRSRCVRARSAPYRPDMARGSPAAVHLAAPSPYSPAMAGRSPAAVRPRCVRARSAPYRPDVARGSPAAVRLAAPSPHRPRFGTSLAHCCAPSLRLCPLCAYRLAVVCCSSDAARPRCVCAHSAPYRPRCVPSLARCCAPSLLLCPLCAVPPAVVRCSSAVVCPRCAYGLSALCRGGACARSSPVCTTPLSLVRCCAPSLRLGPLCVYRLPWYVDRPLLCEFAAPVPALRLCIPSLVCCCAPSLRLCSRCAAPPLAVVGRSSAAVRPRYVCARRALYHLLWYVARLLLCSLAAPVPALPCTPCRGMSLVRCCAPPRRLCPLFACAYRPDVVRRWSVAVRPRYTSAHSARATSRGMSLFCCCAPSLRLFLPSARYRLPSRGMSLVRCCSPSLRLFPPCVPLAVVCRTSVAVRPPSACAHSAPYLLPWYFARLLLCAFAAPVTALRVPPAVVCSSSVAVRPRCACAYRPAVVCRSSAAVRPRCAYGLSAPYHLPCYVDRPLLCAPAAPLSSLRSSVPAGVRRLPAAVPSLRLCPLCVYHQLWSGARPLFALVAPAPALDCTLVAPLPTLRVPPASCGTSLVFYCAPSPRSSLLSALYRLPWHVTGLLGLCPLRAVPPAVVRCSSAAVRPRCACALSAPYH
jgi:hypothetical protein